MKNFLLLALLSLSFTIFAQKKKSVSKVKTETTKSFAKADNLSAEIIGSNFVLSIDNKTALKDTILLSKTLDKKLPIDCKIQAFSAKGTPLYLVSWSEKSKIESKLSKEDVTVTNSVIVNLATKSKIHSNKQLSSEITLIQYLDVKQTVSETVQKRHSEGFAFTLLPDGDVIKKSKTKEVRYTYSKADNFYEEFKKKK